MKSKRSLKYLFVFALLILSTINVNAGLDKDACGETNITVTETSKGEYAGFDTRENRCNWRDTGEFEVIGGAEMSFKDAKEIGLEEIESFHTSADGKGIEGSFYPRCEDPKSKIYGTITADFRYDGVYDEKSGKYICNSGGTGGGDSKYCYIYGVEFKSEDLEAYNEETAYANQRVIVKALRAEVNAKRDSLNNGQSIGHSKFNYFFKCPKYECEKEEFNFGACTPRFTALGTDDVYCVNPTDGFTSGVGNYGVTDFDVTSCKSSYSTLECGYANILIEGKYQKANHNVIELALRLWGVYSNRSGFDENKVGLSWLTAPIGGGACTKGENGDGVFVEKLYNVYRVTYDTYFQRAFNSIPESKDYILISDRYIQTLGCGKLGLACVGSGTSDETVNKAFALVFNTIKGNPYMMQHLEELYGTFSPMPTGVSYEGGENGNSNVIVHYGDKITSVNKNVEIDCKKWKADPNAYAGGAEGFDEVKGYCNDYIIVKDASGRETEYVPDSCKKGVGCRYEKVSIAFCNVESSTQTVTVIHKITEANGSVKKLESCLNPDDQTMYLLTDSSGDGSGKEPKEDKTVSKVFDGPNYSCGNNCENYGLRTQKSSCVYEQGKELNTDDELAKGYIKDPSLKCIANMPDKEKYKYDYSEEFGVNTNFCRIYCSDEVEFMMSNRVTINSGEDIKIDIGVKAGFKYQQGKMISNVVREKRSCISEIYYGGSNSGTGLNFPKEPDWQSMYGITFGAEDNHNIRTLYELLAKKAESEGGRTENLNQVLYDLYNCNLYTEGNIPSIVTKPLENTIGNVYNHIMNTFYPKSQGYGLGLYFDVNSSNGEGSYVSSCASGSAIDSENNNCITMNTITYTGGSERKGTDSNVEEEKIYRVGGGRDGDIRINFGSVTKQDRSPISYCTGANCFSFDKTNTSNEYDYTMNKDGVGTTETLTFKDQNIEVPTNTYALFTVTTDVGFYIKNKFQTTPGTGYIVEADSDEASSDYIDLPEFSLPTSKDAYTLCEADNADIRNAYKDYDTSTRSCYITYEYDKIATYYRKNVSDEFSKTLRESGGTFKKPTCYYNVQTTPPVTDKCKYAACNKENPTEEEKAKCKELCQTEDIVEYKNVNKSDIFPYKTDNSSNEEEQKTNWDTEWAKKVQSYLETTNVETTRYSKDILDYKITLTPEQIKALRKYNVGKSYKNAEVLPQTCTKAGEEGYEKYYNCRSEFMEFMRIGEKEFGQDEYGKLDVDFNGTKFKIDSANKKINDPNYTGD